MKISFLGTSHGIPTAERFCSSLMIEVGGSLYFIDAGAPIVELMLKMGRHPNEIRAVFCTHHHGDHTDGLLGLTDLCNWAFKESSFDIFVTINEQADALKACTELASGPLDEKRLRYHTASAGVIYEDENVKITYFPTKHCEPYPSYAILVEADGKSALFTGDISGKIAKLDFPVYAQENETELVVCEMAHFGRCEVEPYLEKLKTKHLIFNHVNFPLGMDKFADIEDMANSGKFTFSISAAKDGDVIEL